MKLLSLPLLVACTSCSTTPATPVERQMLGLLEKFDRWDENGDGELTEIELKPTEQVTGRPAREVISFYDTSGDGQISLKEAQKGLSRSDEAEAVLGR